MGMFDYVRVAVPLPDGWEPKDLQSKDFDCEMSVIELTADGRLRIEEFEYEGVPKAERPCPDDDGLLGLAGSLRRVNCRWRDINHHGWFNFYGGGFENDWHEYNAKFTDGQLVEIVAVKESEPDAKALGEQSNG